MVRNGKYTNKQRAHTYIMYSHKEHGFIHAMYLEDDGRWVYDTDKDLSLPYTPDASDVIVAE